MFQTPARILSQLTMENYLLHFVTIAGILYVIESELFWLTIWQNANYRIGGIFPYLKRHRLFTRAFLNWFNIFQIVLIGIYFATLIETRSFLLYRYAIVGYFVLYILFLFWRIKKRKVFFPKVTVRNALAFVVVFLILLSILLFPILDLFFWILFVTKFVPFLIGIAVLVISIPVEFFKGFLLVDVAKKIQKNKKLTVIAIIGDQHNNIINRSAFTLLSARHSVVHTEKEGSIFDLAKTIQKKLTPKTEVLIVDLNIYNKEDFIEIGNLLNPKICIVNAADQNNLDKTQKRGIQSFLSYIQNKGVLIWIGQEDSQFTKYKKKKYLVVPKATKTDGIVAMFKNIIAHRQFVTFDAIINSKKAVRFKTKILGLWSPQYMTAAAVVALEMGDPVFEIKRNMEKINSVVGIMSSTQTEKGTVLINNTLRWSADEMLSFTGSIRGITGRNILIMDPSVSESEFNRRYYYEIGKKIGKIFDVLILLNEEHAKSIKTGILNSRGDCEVSVMNVMEAVKHVNTTTRAQDVVVLEGSRAHFVYRKVQKQKKS